MGRIVFILLFFPCSLFGQKTNELITLRVGYSSTNIAFKEAFNPSINVFGRPFDTGSIFVGEGPEFGISKEISNRTFIDLAFSTFSGQASRLKINNFETYYTIKGFQVPLTVNYLLRDSTKRFRINMGMGVQYVKSHLQQYGILTNPGNVLTNQIADIKITELQLVLQPGIQLRIIPNLYTSFIVKVCVSTSGRYSDHPCLSLKYAFINKTV